MYYNIDLNTLLGEKLKALTNNHRIGFGTFVDKTTAPYIYTTEAR